MRLLNARNNVLERSFYGGWFVTAYDSGLINIAHDIIQEIEMCILRVTLSTHLSKSLSTVTTVIGAKCVKKYDQW